MQRTAVGATVAVLGLLVSWAGQGVWRTSPDALWAAVGVVSLLSGVAIAINPTISRLLARR